MSNIYGKMISLFLFVFIFFNFSYADDQIVSTKLGRCITCHTANGNSISPIWPKLAEQHSNYMVKQLLEFKKGKDGDRYDPTMLGMMQGITENEILELSEYFSKQILEKKKVKVNKSDFEIGKNIYLFGDKDSNLTACVGCHGKDGTGNKLANFPSLRWQHKDYIVIQLKKFKTHDRHNDINGIMRDIFRN
jgi:cytochrome c553